MVKLQPNFKSLCPLKTKIGSNYVSPIRFSGQQIELFFLQQASMHFFVLCKLTTKHTEVEKTSYISLSFSRGMCNNRRFNLHLLQWQNLLQAMKTFWWRKTKAQLLVPCKTLFHLLTFGCQAQKFVPKKSS